MCIHTNYYSDGLRRLWLLEKEQKCFPRSFMGRGMQNKQSPSEKGNRSLESPLVSQTKRTRLIARWKPSYRRLLGLFSISTFAEIVRVLFRHAKGGQTVFPSFSLFSEIRIRTHWSPPLSERADQKYCETIKKLFCIALSGYKQYRNRNDTLVENSKFVY